MLVSVVEFCFFHTWWGIHECRLCCFVLFMSSRNVSYCGDYLQAKLKVEAERLNKAGVRLTQGYKKEDARMFFVFSNNFYLHTRITNICFHFMITYMSFAWHATVMQNAALLSIHVLINWLTSVGKQSRQVQLCTKVPPSSNKRFFGGNLLCSLVLASLAVLFSSWSELSSQIFKNYSLTC